MTRNQQRVLELLEKQQPLTSTEIREQLIETEFIPEQTLFSVLTQLRRAGQIRRRRPTSEEEAQRVGSVRYVYEIGSGSEDDLDPRAKNYAGARPLRDRLKDAYARRRTIQTALDEVEGEIAQLEAEVQQLKDIVADGQQNLI